MYQDDIFLVGVTGNSEQNDILALSAGVKPMIF